MPEVTEVIMQVHLTKDRQSFFIITLPLDWTEPKRRKLLIELNDLVHPWQVASGGYTSADKIED